MKKTATLIVAGCIGAACATDAPAPRQPEPVIITKEVEKIVRIRCEDKREPAEDYPDDDADLAMVSLADPLAIFKLSQKYVAARELYRKRLKADDDQIAACAQTQ